MKTDDLLTEQLHIPAEFRRPSYTTREDEQLEKAIKKDGVNQMLVVLQSEGIYKVIKGTRRLIIAKGLGIPRLACNILTLPEGVEEMAFMRKERFMVDEHRQALLPTQRAMLVEEIKRTHKFSNAQVADYLGVVSDTIGNWTDILKMPKKIQDAIDRGEIKEHAIRPLRALKPEAQLDLFEKHKNELTNSASAKVFKARFEKQYSPEKTPELYTAPKLSANIRKAATGKPRSRRVTKNYSDAEKRKLIENLTLQDTEAKQEKKLTGAINAINTKCIPVVDVMLNTEEIRLKLPEEMLFQLQTWADKWV